jgi:hypothetical protein
LKNSNTYQCLRTFTERTRPELKFTEHENENHVRSNPRFPIAVPVTQSWRPGLSTGIVFSKATYA